MATEHAQVRGDKLVSQVLRATLAEVARVGVSGLSMEEVAARAGVNKTTIYRRWPTPEALARAALVCASEVHSTTPDTGSLRGDLHAFASEFRRLAMQPEMRTIMRLRWSGDMEGPLAKITRSLQERKHAEWHRMLQRAVARGELTRRTDLDLLQDVLVGALVFLVVLSPRRSTRSRLIRAVDAVLDGVLPSRSRRSPVRRRSG
jgi:AcrR family transcriptional regulator